MIPVPVIAEVNAGKPGDWIPIKGLRWIRPLRDDPQGRFTIAIRISGESMNPDGLADGSWAIVYRRFEPEQINGCISLVQTPHGLCVKRIDLRDEDTVALVSSNPKFKEQVWPANEIQVIGIIKRAEIDFE